jgi:hypothetical protein
MKDAIKVKVMSVDVITRNVHHECGIERRVFTKGGFNHPKHARSKLKYNVTYYIIA